MMNGDDLDRGQCERLSKAVGRQLRYLRRLTDRMNQRGWDSQDPLYLAAFRAHDAVYGLYLQIHYASCKSGVGHPPRDDPPASGRPGPG
jgi:ankyrin repeat protein